MSFTLRFTSLLLGGALLAVGAGCTIPYADADLEQQINHCASDDDCAEGAVCVASLNQCIATKADLNELFMVVRPNSTAKLSARSSIILQPNEAIDLSSTDEEGVIRRFKLSIPKPMRIEGGKVVLDYTGDCALPPDRSIPAKITFQRKPPQLGLLRYEPITITTKQEAGASSPYTFNADIPKSTYDVYIEPLPIEGCAANPPPPVFIRGYEVQKDGGLTFNMAKPELLTGYIKVPIDGDISNWTLDLVEPEYGNRISTTQIINQKGLNFLAKIELQFVPTNDQSSPLIRLEPPKGEPKPKVYWSLYGSVGAQSKYDVNLTIEDLRIEPRHVQVQVQNEEGKGVSAAIAIHSVSLSGNVASIASYSIDTETTALQGTKLIGFEADLPPGSYKVRATPLDSENALAVEETDLEVPALDLQNGEAPGCVCGKVITLHKRVQLEGRVLTPTPDGGGEPLVDATILTSPSQTAYTTYWRRVHELDPLVPRPTLVTTDSEGGFKLFIDPGESDFAVQPRDSSGYPWLVRPRFGVSSSDKQVNLGELHIPNPVVVSGSIVDWTGAPVSNADIEAYLPVHDETKADGLLGTAMQIGSTATDEKGQFRLLLPASISQ